MNTQTKISVVAVLLLHPQDPDSFYIALRPDGSGWEFPGGKLEKGENPEICLIREIKEEIGVDLENFCFSPLIFTLNEYENFDVLLLLFICREWEGIVSPKENQNIKWVFVNKLFDSNLLPGDQKLIPYIRDAIKI